MKTVTGVITRMLALTVCVPIVLLVADRGNTVAGAQTQDRCAAYKKDVKKYAACQKAVESVTAKSKTGNREEKNPQAAGDDESVRKRVAVCTNGYWWTMGSLGGPMTQGGSCSPEGATKSAVSDPGNPLKSDLRPRNLTNQ